VREVHSDMPTMNGLPPGPEPRLDEQALARLRELDPDGRNDVVGRVMRTYETSLVAMIAQLGELRARQDAAGLRALAHKMKASSAAVGALALAVRCAEVERLVREGTSIDVDAEVETLLAQGEDALVAVRAILRP
jgi:HPt (histidine-containing phosphotransfer) domain-containing protein